MVPLSNHLKDYLEISHYIDWDNPEIMTLAGNLKSHSENEVELVKNTYHYVRDEIKHSWDIRDRRVTARASDVLKEKVGICWAKANLLAGLLRANKIPAGICYQRLTLGDTPDTGYCIHALNAAYIQTVGKWIRMDARGNKEGINAEFHLDKEQLAFPIRINFEEVDYEQIFVRPDRKCMGILEKNMDAIYMYLNCLPDRL
jgi:transglutaminase-like putative cysteine protease